MPRDFFVFWWKDSYGDLISLKSLSYLVNDWHFMGAPHSGVAKSVYYNQSYYKYLLSKTSQRATKLKLPPLKKSISG